MIKLLPQQSKRFKALEGLTDGSPDTPQGLIIFMKLIYLGGKYGSIIGNYAIVDDEDFDRVNKFNWTAYLNDGNFYCYTGRGDKKKILHRFIMEITDKNILVDHTFGNGFDNQKTNLRICNHAQNMSNRRKVKGSLSVFLGVHKDGNKWMAACKKDKVSYRSRGHNSQEDAALAYNELATKHHGEFARLNIIN